MALMKLKKCVMNTFNIHYKIDIFQKNLIDDHDFNDFEGTTDLKEHMESVSKPQNTFKKCKTTKVLKKKLNFSSPVRIRKSPAKSRLDEYNMIVQEKFQEFLVNKLRSSSESPKKSEILEEFSSYLTKIDQETILNLWDDENLAKTALGLKV